MPPFFFFLRHRSEQCKKGLGKRTDPFKQLYDWLARESRALLEPVLYPFHAPMHRLVLLTEAQAGVIYPKELYRFRVPAFSEVYGDEVEDAIVSVAVQ